MQLVQIQVLNETGLHARPCAFFVQTARKFHAGIHLRNLSTGSDWADAKSILGVLALGVEHGHEVELKLEGSDEVVAAQAIRDAVQAGLGEKIVPLREPPGEKAQSLSGIGAAPGLSQGPAFLWDVESLAVPRYTVTSPEAEMARIQAARQAAHRELEGLIAKVASEAGSQEADIFESHQLFLDDSSLLEHVEAVVNQGVNAEAAWIDGATHFADQLEKLPNPILSARAIDVRDVSERVLRHLLGRESQPKLHLQMPAVIIARDLTPSQTAAMPKGLVLGFCTAEGGPTSHTAILSKALGLPAVVGLGEAILRVPTGTPLLVDGLRGEVIVRPDFAQRQVFQKLQAALSQRASAEKAVAAQPARSVDGRAVEIVANVGGIEDARTALEYGAEGIGLLRTEFLYLKSDIAPSEEEQVQAYFTIFEIMGSRPVVVRTLDIGGDKMLPYLDLGVEANPFLGWRAIRLCLDQPEFFKVQLRALLHAGVGHDLRIMFPLIATLDEIKKAKALLAQARHELEIAGRAAASSVQVGMMVEIPAAAIMADLFSREVDFFSIGTNDLTQYTMAAERTNKKVAYLGDACHPAVLRQIREVVNAGHTASVWVGVCGELAGDPEAIPILLGLGVDELSMAPVAIPQAKAIIRHWRMQDARQLADQVLGLESARDVRQHVQVYRQQERL